MLKTKSRMYQKTDTQNTLQIFIFCLQLLEICYYLYL